MPKHNRLEDGLQRAVVQLLTVYERQGLLMFFHIPNGGKRSKTEARIMKGLGVRAGVPDICIIMKDASVIFMELKAPKGKLSAAQSYFIDFLHRARVSVFVIRDVSEVPYRLGFKQRTIAA